MLSSSRNMSFCSNITYQVSHSTDKSLTTPHTIYYLLSIIDNFHLFNQTYITFDVIVLYICDNVAHSKLIH